ncbi:ribonuclease H-like domain-containing protein [Gautieria morchelliformis]|nr:ribonuclease H-like domain-containing protein [Gautieria morchelliformis]
MPKAGKTAFYAVHVGHQPGVYSTWADCEQYTKGYPKAQFKKFSTRAEAEAFVKSGSGRHATASAASGKAVSSKSRDISSGPYKKTYMTKKLGKQKADVVTDESEWEVVYTDGACQGNGRAGAIAGIGVWWGQNDPRNLAERCPGDQTNNRAELIAIIRLLETAPHSMKPLLIKTDSSYSISCVRDWIPSWQKRRWKTADGQDVKNKAVILYLSYLLDQRARLGQRVQLQHVRGHAGIVGNEGADKLAGEGALMSVAPERDWTLPKMATGPEADAIGEFQARSHSLTAL